MILPTTLSLAAAAAVLNCWLILRCGKVRFRAGVLHGDGGDPLLLKRMRAHANFVENAPFVLILIAAIELTGKGGRWLAIVGAIFMLARISHAFGMDVEKPNVARVAGILTSVLVQLGLAAVAVLVTVGVI